MKAVIMAGGSGKRLMPLTYSTPKPMVRFFSKPILAHIIELLSENGFDDITLTLGYMAKRIEEYIENTDFGNIKITLSKEEKPLGTAGSVKNAVKNAEEPFLVISGDCVCDFDLKKIMEYHLQSKAFITIACKSVEDPREYGVVEFDESDKVKAFTEKPPWSCAVSNQVNTGIYVLDPAVLNYIPEDRSFDFSGDLFPLVMSEGKSIMHFDAEGYWCDVGNPQALSECARHVLDGKVRLFLDRPADGVFLADGLPSGNYSIVPPCFIGKNVKISDGAVIGPYTVIDDGCTIGKDSLIEGTLVFPESRVFDRCSIINSIICTSSSVRSGSRLSQGSVIGEHSVIGADCIVGRGVTVPPESVIQSGELIREDIKSVQTFNSLTDFGSFSGRTDFDFDSVNAALIGQAIACSSVGGKVGILTDGEALSSAVACSLVGAMQLYGTHVWNFGEGFYTQLNFFVKFCSLECGIFVSSKQQSVSITLCGENGLPLKNDVCRDIETRIRYRRFDKTDRGNCRRASDMTGVAMMYRREIVRQTDTELSDIGCCVKSENEKIRLLLEDCLYRLGCKSNTDITFRINGYGNLLTAFTRESGWISHDRLSAVCLNYEAQCGRDISVPFNSPHIFEAIASKYGRKIYRFYSSGPDSSDSAARELARADGFMRDALFMSVKLLSIINITGKSLDRLVNEIPDFYVSRRQIPISFSPSELSSRLSGENSSVTREGIILEFDSGRVLLTPTRTGKSVKILAEASNFEASKELSIIAQKKLKG